MKTVLEPEDIQAIAEKVTEMLKPILVSNGNTKPESDVIFDVKRLQVYLNVSDKWIYERTHLKEIPHIKSKGLLRFRKKDIDKWLNQFNVPTTETHERILKRIK